MAVKGSKSKTYIVPIEEIESLKKHFKHINRKDMWTEKEFQILMECCDERGNRAMRFKEISELLLKYGDTGIKRSRCGIERKLKFLRDDGRYK